MDAAPDSGRRPRLIKLVLLGLVLALPAIPGMPFALQGNINTGARFALIGISIVVLTGWVGQISLGHAGFVGVGTYVAGMAVGGLKIGFPVALLWGGVAGMLAAIILGVVALRVRGLYLAVATLLFSWMAEKFLFRDAWFTKHATIPAQATGEPNSFPFFDWSNNRKAYYYLAWATLAVALFLMANLRDSKTGRAFFAVRGSEVAAASLGIDIMRTKLVAFALSGMLAGIAGGLTMAELGTISPDMFEVSDSLFFLSIAVVGGLGSLGGSIAAGLVFAVLEYAFFNYEFLSGYLEVVAAALLAIVLLAYRGGLAAIPESLAPAHKKMRRVFGPVNRVLDGAYFGTSRAARRILTAKPASADAAMPTAPSKAPLITRLSAGKIKPRRVVRRSEKPLDLFKVGAAVKTNGNGHHASDGISVGTLPVDAVIVGDSPAPLDALQSSLDVTQQQNAGPAPRRDWRAMVLPTEPLAPERSDRRALIDAAGITVKFGGLTAVNNASLKICEGEIVGLIGPNGAGKTTLFNSIAGLNVPTAGTVTIYDQDVTSWPVHQRAQFGVGRTFQAIQLFGQLSVFDNLLVATDQHNPTGLFAHLAVSNRSVAAEQEARRQVRRALELLDLTSVADRRAKDLPFGVLRMVELARAMVTGSRLIMLDEPASGLDNKETDRLADILKFVRSLGVTLLLIEHDVRMVTGCSDYMYVLDRGNMISEGTPDAVQRDDRVITAYLGQQTTEEVGA